MPLIITAKATMNVTNGMPYALFAYNAAPAACGYLPDEFGVGGRGERRQHERHQERQPQRPADLPGHFADQGVDPRAENVPDHEQQQHLAPDHPLERVLLRVPHI